MRKLLILGMGNSIVSDDRIGLWIVEKMAELADNPGIEIKTLEAGGLDILEAMTGFDFAIVIDAIKTGTHKPGEIIHVTPEQFSSTPRGKAVHDVSFFDAIELGKRMNLKVPDRIDILAIEVIDSITIGESISPQVMEAVDPAIKRVMDLIEETGIQV
jgi:hydrogenase maturation protease